MTDADGKAESPTPKTTSRFDGAGVSHAAKFLGTALLADSQSQLLCQQAMQTVLAGLKGRKEPKERLEVRLSLSDGVQIRETSPSSTTNDRKLVDLSFRHSEISYVFKEPRDQRSCGLVRTEPDPESPGRTVSRFYAIRTVKSAAPLMQDLRELFRLVKESRDEEAEKATAGESKQSSENFAGVGGGDSSTFHQPEATEPQLTQPDVTQPDVTQPEVTQPDVTQPEVTQPDVMQPQLTQPEVTQPEVTQPEVTQPDCDLLDIRPTPLTTRQTAASSSLGSLDELSELFSSSQASLASSGVGDGCSAAPAALFNVSFNPWTLQPLGRQLSQPHHVPAQLAAEPCRKASHPNMPDRRHSSGFHGNNYHGNKRPSDPGMHPAAFYGQYQPAEYFYYQQQQQQQPQTFAANPFASLPFAPGPYHPLYLYQHQQQQHQYGQQYPCTGQLEQQQPMLPPTFSTQLIEGDFVSVFDMPSEAQQQQQQQQQQQK